MKEIGLGLALILALTVGVVIGKYADSPPPIASPAEQCNRLHAVQWCMSNDGCMVTVDEVEEAKALHAERVCDAQ